LERRDLYPSNAILDLHRLRSGKAEATYRDALDTMPAPGGFFGEVSLSITEWWIRRGEQGQRVGAAAVGQAYPWLAEGAAAMAARDSDELTKWDGFIDAPPEEVDPRYTGKVYSASQLENMAKCPISYFFQRHLRIEPVEELLRDPDVWLNAMENGSLFHEIAERFMKELNGEVPLKTHRQRLEQIADESLASWRQLVPPPNEMAFAKRRDDLFETLTVFLRGEIDSAARARYFEAAFGYPEKEGETIGMSEPLVLDLGGGRSIKVRGKIDRVDFDEASKLWNVWDYKTGSTYEYKDHDRLARGTKIQHAIYARAICAMLQQRGIEAKVGQSGYYFPTPKGRANRQARPCGDGELEHALNLLFDTVGRGFFPHPTEEACRYCDYEELCGGDRKLAAEQMARKFAANSDHPAVRAWLALQEIK
jgi:ATP-dependent helicase/nuclease subunit B